MRPVVYFWNSAPVFRFLLALIAGIFLQREYPVLLPVVVIFTFTCIALVVLYSLLPISLKYKLRITAGVIMLLLMACVGCLLVWIHDVRNDSDWIGHHYNRGDVVVGTIEEPLVEKQNSFKAVASVSGIYSGRKFTPAVGKVILYFRKDGMLKRPGYGSVLLFSNLQPVTNSGNPGGFDYRQYCLSAGITHQAYLTPEKFRVVPVIGGNAFRRFIYNSRTWILSNLRKHIRGEKELGLAEALLIGYRDDLDKDLVQAYSNTGVVHVIAISGLHLGLIYSLLLLVTIPLKKLSLPWLRVMVICVTLWLFSILAGAQASVLRSAVMFSFIAVGELLSKKGAVLNTLSLSAFLLLCFNPFWLWDLGFQLSYSAVLSIILFFRPVYNWLFTQNRLLDLIWKLCAVTISAQLLTLPLSVFHFHQVPVFFLFTNLVAVPLGSVILIGEIILLSCFFLQPVANLLGTTIDFLISCMNRYVERWDAIPFSIWDSLQVSSIQLFFLFVFISGTAYWMLDKNKTSLKIGLISFLLFSVLRSLSFRAAYSQRKIIVYNVPKHRAIDIIDGRTFCFLGDSALIQNKRLQAFHLQPSRVMHRAGSVNILPAGREFVFYGKRVLLLDTATRFSEQKAAPTIDLLILSKNPRLYISRMAATLNIKQVIIDGSVPRWKAALWQRDCDSLSIPCHDVSVKGAFVMNLR